MTQPSCAGVRVIFVNRYFYPDHSATSQMLTGVATALAEHGTDVQIITSRQRYDDPDARLAATERLGSIRIRRIWTSTFGRAWLPGRVLDYLSFYLSLVVVLVGRTRRGDILICKTDPPLLSVIAWLLPLPGVYRVHWLQDVFPEIAAALGVGGVRGVWGGMLRWLRDRSLRAASQTVVLSADMRDYLLSRCVAPERLSVIPNWADERVLEPVANDRNPLRENWGLRARFVVGYSGNMGRAHEFVTLLDAAEQLRAQEEIRFLFIGGGGQRDWLEQQARARGLENVLFQPYQPGEVLKQSLSAADIHFISLREGLENFVVPSKFYGICAVGRASLYLGVERAEIPRLIQESDCGWCLDIGDADGLAGLILMLSRDRDAVISAGRRARVLFEQRFTRARVSTAWLTLLSHSERDRVLE